MADKLIFAYPSKGRLRAAADERLASVGWSVADPADKRRYGVELRGAKNVGIWLVEAAAIPGLLARGEAHTGITGQDLVQEYLADPSATLDESLPLGFGHARLAVAVPECWIDVDDMTDLDDVAYAFRREHGRRLRVATGFRRLAQQFLAEHCAAEYELVQSRGPTEAAPLAGLSECIVDLVATGTTLRANHLKIPDGGVILESEASLWASNTATWDKDQRRTFERVRAKLAGG